MSNSSEYAIPKVKPVVTDGGKRTEKTVLSSSSPAGFVPSLEPETGFLQVKPAKRAEKPIPDIGGSAQTDSASPGRQRSSGEQTSVKADSDAGVEEYRAVSTLFEPGLLTAIYQARNATKDRLVSHGGKDWWPAQNSPIEAYEMDFADVLEGKKIADLLTGINGAVVVDLMAPTGTIADLFSQLSPDPDRRGIALSSRDNRDEAERERDTQLGIVQLEGDITRPLQLAEKLQAELGDKKANIIMIDAGLGKKYIPDHPQYRRMIMQVLWNFVSEDNGVLLIDLPLNTEVIEWREIVRQHGIEIRAPRYGHSLFMVKNPDSPKLLPRIPSTASDEEIV